MQKTQDPLGPFRDGVAGYTFARDGGAAAPPECGSPFVYYGDYGDYGSPLDPQLATTLVQVCCRQCFPFRPNSAEIRPMAVVGCTLTLNTARLIQWKINSNSWKGEHTARKCVLHSCRCPPSVP
jgi:hypothetical protein